MSRDQAKDLAELHKAIDEAPYSPPCENFPDAFFPDDRTSIDNKLAKELCRVCPVIAECGRYALKWAEFGIWGGMTAQDRKRIRSGS